MHAVVVESHGQRRRGGREITSRADVVPGVSQAPGFIAGYWTRKDNNGLSMIIVESEEQANQLGERVKSYEVPPAVTLESVDIRQVVANA